MTRRLSWQGNIEAQRLYEAAKVPKPKKHGKKRQPQSKRPPYKTYLRSDHWKKRRAAALERANNHCERCGAYVTLQVHHLSYKRLFFEWDEDLVVLCKACHDKAHPK